MKTNVLAPSVGESITEVSILKWAKPDGSAVKNGEKILEIESDKATVEIVAEAAGVLRILKPEGERIAVGTVIGEIDDAGKATASAAAPAKTSGASMSAPQATVARAAGAVAAGPASAMPGPAARKMLADQGLDAFQISGTGKDGRVTKGDILTRGTAPASTPAAAPAQPARALLEGERRQPMTMLRARIAERLVQAQHTAAILTTFNEADMGPVMELRNKHKDAFKAKHGVPLSFMSFFTRACVEALKVVPEVNGSIEGRDVIYRDFVDMGIAVGTERGLVVPVVRAAHKMGFVEIEKAIAVLAEKARASKLSIADLSGGTFTISNGGTYGSLLSTPILNPPQSGILGMHKIQERPMAVNGKVEIRPMMYLALSYDHRIIDGKGAVTFLVTVKDFIEHPEKLGLEV
jgi:2-oxoglutarate dehydrogenase E2 component (dihydrolipoamide succinyltransferase)